MGEVLGVLEHGDRVARRGGRQPLGGQGLPPEPGRIAWYLPRVVERSGLANLPGLPAGAPVVVQEYVAHDAEYRVYLTGDELHAFEVAKEHPEDVWTRPDAVAVRRVPVPDAVASAVRALGADLGVVHGAFDLLRAGDEPVFLEVNAHGDRDWFEHRAGTDVVTRAVVRSVRDLHRSVLGGARPAAVSLLAFLGAGRGR